MVGATAETVIVAAPETFVYPDCVDLAVQDALPAPEGVKTPAEVMEPPLADQVTAVLNAPVPLTVAEQVEVCAVVMEAGDATTTMPVTVAEGEVIARAAVPDFVESSVEVALTVSAPEVGALEGAV
jgi:hypothetical protein